MVRDAAASTVHPLRAAPTVRTLLTGGVVAGPLFLIVALIQAAPRPGFDWVRHPLSLLSLGNFGWVQIANFVLTGVLFIGSAAGMVVLALSAVPPRGHFLALWAAAVVGFVWPSAVAARLRARFA